MRLSGRDEHRVMKAMAGKSGMAMREGACPRERATAASTGRIPSRRRRRRRGHRASLAERGGQRLLARRSSSDGRLNLDE